VVSIKSRGKLNWNEFTRRKNLILSKGWDLSNQFEKKGWWRLDHLHLPVKKSKLKKRGIAYRDISQGKVAGGA